MQNVGLPLILLSATTGLSLAQSPSTGTITIDGKKIPITNACAFEEIDNFDPQKVRLFAIFWTDGKPLEGTSRNAASELEVRRKTTQAPYLIAELQLPSLRFIGGTLGHGEQPQFFSFSGGDPWLEFKPSAGGYQKPQLSGRFYTTHTFQLGLMAPLDIDITVSGLPVEPDTPLSNEIKGTAAAQHPAAKAALRYLTAMSKGDVATMRSLFLEADRPAFDAAFAGDQAKEMLAVMAQMANANLAMPIYSVATKGNVTVVKLRKATDTSTENTAFTLRLEKGHYYIAEQN